jgi:hypothetical protein
VKVRFESELRAGGGVSWEDALAELEARLVAAEAVLELAEPVGLEPFVPPAVDGPLDPALADRARALLTRGEDVQARLEARRDQVRADLRRLPKLPAPQGKSRFEVSA